MKMHLVNYASDFFRRISFACVCVGSLTLSCIAQEAEVEIFIPGSKIEDVSSDLNASNLARCLNSGKIEYCVGLQLEGDGSIYESFDQKQISLETFIFSDSEEVSVKPKNTDDLPSETVQKPVVEPVEKPNQTGPANTVSSVSVEILFDFDSFKIRPDQISKIRTLAGALSEDLNAQLSFAIIGHTDAKGSEGYNCKLSEGRASSVVTALKIEGAISDLYAIGAGEFLLKNAENSEDEKNRRVSIVKLEKAADRTVKTMSALCS